MLELNAALGTRDLLLVHFHLAYPTPSILPPSEQRTRVRLGRPMGDREREGEMHMYIYISHVLGTYQGIY